MGRLERAGLCFQNGERSFSLLGVARGHSHVPSVDLSTIAIVYICNRQAGVGISVPGERYDSSARALRTVHPRSQFARCLHIFSILFSASW